MLNCAPMTGDRDLDEELPEAARLHIETNGVWYPVPSLPTNHAPIDFDPSVNVGLPSSSASMGTPGHRPQPPFVGGPVTSLFVEPCTVNVADASLLL